jgi:hypothetical protein
MRCYTVQQGDSLSQIALDFNVDIRFLSMFNHIWDQDMIFEGQRLCVPPGAPRPMPQPPVTCGPPMNCFPGNSHPSYPMPMPYNQYQQTPDMPNGSNGAVDGLGMQPQFGMPPMPDSMMGYGQMPQQMDPYMMGQQPPLGYYGEMPQQMSPFMDQQQMGYGDPQQMAPYMMDQQPQLGYGQMDLYMMGQQPQLGYGQMPQQMDPNMMSQGQQPVNYVNQ